MSTLVYLSCPFGGDRLNLYRAIDHLAWAHSNTAWGIWVQAPWIANAMAELERGTTEEQYRSMGGIDVERRVLDGFDAVLHMGVPTPAECSPGMCREARYMALRGCPVYHRMGDNIIDTTGHYR